MVTRERGRLGGLDGIEIAFDDGALVADAGLILPATLCDRLGAEAVLEGRVRRPGDRRGGGGRALSVVFAVLAGADCIDDIERLRAGRAGRYSGSTRAPARPVASGCGAWASARCASSTPPPASCCGAPGARALAPRAS